MDPPEFAASQLLSGESSEGSSATKGGQGDGVGVGGT